MSNEPTSLPRVVILGGGFAGLYAARTLHKAPVRITLVDRHNHHLFQPLLYQVATGALTAASISAPLRTILRRQANVETWMATACAIDPVAQVVKLGEGSIAYDYLLLATGSTFSYFGHDEWEARAPGLKTIDDAVEIRNRLFRAFEAAEREQDAQACSEWLTFVVVGAGPTGVELAGTMAEIARRALTQDFRHIDPSRARIVLLDAAPKVLPVYTDDLTSEAHRHLCKLGIEVLTGEMVVDVNENGVRCKSGTEIRARTVIWAAGVAATPVVKSLGAPQDRQGRIKVNPDLTVPGYPNVFVAGDLVYLEQDGKPIPGLAPAAIQEGRHAAANILRAVRGQPLEPFHYNHRGSFAVIGRGVAVGEVRERWHMSGFTAWLAWLFIHLYFLIGFHNRVMVMLSWAYSYFTHRRGARVVTGEDKFGLRKPRYTAHGLEDTADASAGQAGQAQAQAQAQATTARPATLSQYGAQPAAGQPSPAAAQRVSKDEAA